MKIGPIELVHNAKSNTKTYGKCAFNVYITSYYYCHLFSASWWFFSFSFWGSKDFIECGRYHSNAICCKISVSVFYDSSGCSLKSPADCLWCSRCLRNICWIQHNISIFREILHMKTQVHSHACVFWLLESLVFSICFTILNKNTSGNLLSFLLMTLQQYAFGSNAVILQSWRMQKVECGKITSRDRMKCSLLVLGAF